MLSTHTMQYQIPLLALLSLVHGSELSNAQSVQNALNAQLLDTGAVSPGGIDSFVVGTDGQVGNAVHAISNGDTQDASDFVKAAANGAQALLASLNIAGSGAADADRTNQLLNDYSQLIAVAGQSGVDAGNLQDLADQISAHTTRAKRDDGGMSGIKGAITNFKQTVDTMKQNMQDRKGTNARDTVDAFITGADSQIDNAAATISQGLNGVTLGISGKIGDFLLGPFVQSVTNGAEVMISNVVGGSVDIVSDGTAKLFSESLSKLHSLAVKNNVNSNDTEALAKAQKQVKDLKAPKKDKKEKKD